MPREVNNFEIVKKVDALSQQILDLRQRIRTIQTIAQELSKAIQGIDKLTNQAIQFTQTLVEESETWTSELSNRYTFLINLREWLLMSDESKEPDDRTSPPAT